MVGQSPVSDIGIKPGDQPNYPPTIGGGVWQHDFPMPGDCICKLTVERLEGAYGTGAEGGPDAGKEIDWAEVGAASWDSGSCWNPHYPFPWKTSYDSKLAGSTTFTFTLDCKGENCPVCNQFFGKSCSVKLFASLAGCTFAHSAASFGSSSASAEANAIGYLILAPAGDAQSAGLSLTGDTTFGREGETGDSGHLQWQGDAGADPKVSSSGSMAEEDSKTDTGFFQMAVARTLTRLDPLVSVYIGSRSQVRGEGNCFVGGYSSSADINIGYDIDLSLQSGGSVEDQELRRVIGGCRTK